MSDFIRVGSGSGINLDLLEAYVQENEKQVSFYFTSGNVLDITAEDVIDVPKILSGEQGNRITCISKWIIKDGGN